MSRRRLIGLLLGLGAGSAVVGCVKTDQYKSNREKKADSKKAKGERDKNAGAIP